MDTIASIRGSLLGLAWGDVLGCPVEGWRTDQIQAVYGRYDGLPEAYHYDAIRQAGPKLRRLRPLGLHSDDTQQALALINVCLEGWSCDAWASCLVEGLERRAWRGFGRNFSSAVHALRKGIPPEMAGSASAGMGAAMRSGPLGALYHKEPDTLANIAWESSLMTHGDVRAGALAYAVAWAVGQFVAGRSAEEVADDLPAAVAEREIEWLDKHPEWTIERQDGRALSTGLAAILAKRDLPPLELRQVISDTAAPHLAEGFTRAHPNQGFVLLGGAHALAMALRPSAEPNELLLDIVRQGFDTDTVAAIAGSVLGARFGDGWIHTECFQDGASLSDYAQALAQMEAPETLPRLLAREAKWTQEERDFQQRLVP